MFSSRHVRLPVKLQWCMYLHLIRHSISMSQNNTILGLHPAPLFAYRIMCPPPSQLDLAPRVSLSPHQQASQVQGRPGRLPALPPAVLCTVYAGGEHHKEPVPGARSHRFSPARNHSLPHRRHGRMSITVRSVIWLHPTDTAPSLSFFRDPSPGRRTETIPAESEKKKRQRLLLLAAV